MRELKITRSKVETILELLFDTYGVDVDEDTFRADYSGRGMFDDSCIGFVVSPRAQLALGGAITRAYADVDDGEHEYGNDVRLISVARVDQMAFDVIVYFPGFTVDEEN